MNSNIEVILISQSPLPFSKIGSWTTLYENYFKDNNHKIDYIVCPKPEEKYQGIKYSFAVLTFWHKLQRKFLKRKNLEYFEALDKIIVPNKKYIIQIVDNYGMVKPLKRYLISKRFAEQSYIQFFYHGYLPYFNQNSGRDFYEIIDELIVLTNDSYQEYKKRINTLPIYFSVLHNGIDSEKFNTISDFEKITLKRELGFEDKKVFVWCSNDRPKKGLHLILAAWRTVYSEHKNCVLLVIGNSSRQKKIDGVFFLGKISNEELPKYYQASDCYLFPTLCQEGFGLSLIEALHCGNYCIASALGGVPEVLQYGKIGKLIENPHFVSEWEVAINEFIRGNSKSPKIESTLYSAKKWNGGMNKIIDDAKNRVANNLIQL